MAKSPTKSAFKRLRDKYAAEIVPLYANHPYRYLVEEVSRIQDISDIDIDSMDLATGKGGSYAAYNLLKVLCSKKLPAILAKFPNQNSVDEAYIIISAVGAVTGDVTATELTAEVFLKYHGNPKKLEEILDSQQDILNVRAYTGTLRKYLKDDAQ